MPTPALIFTVTIRVTVGAPVDIGQVPAGRRRIVPILGGTFEGPDIRGRVIAGGADWQIIRPDGLAELDARYLLETDEGWRVTIRNTGIRHAPADVTAKLLAGEPVDPALVYFKTIPQFETSVPTLAWLTRAVFIGEGERHPTEVVIHVWRLA